MRQFAEVWNNYAFVQQVVAQIPWRTNILLLERVKNEVEHKWYVQIGVADWEIKLKNAIGMNIESSFPAIESIEKELSE